jgi:hypothetical protein
MMNRLKTSGTLLRFRGLVGEIGVMADLQELQTFLPGV